MACEPESLPPDTLRYDSGGGDVPTEAREKVCEVIATMEKLGVHFNNGSTALYWHLLSVLDSHMKK